MNSNSLKPNLSSTVWQPQFTTAIAGFFEGILGARFGSLKSEKIGSLQIQIGFLTLSFKKPWL